MEKYDVSQITEFPRFETKPTQSGVTSFFSKIWKFPIFSPGEASEGQQGNSSGVAKPQSRQGDGTNSEYDDGKTEPGSYAVELEGRSLTNVLQRISSLVALGSGSGTKYADTELARYWMPDDISRECYECAARFSTLRRRHHCRVCGQIFCSRCCNQRVPGQIFGCAGGLRVCNYCCNVVLSYLHENEMTGEISPDLRSLQENLQVKFPENKSSPNTVLDRFTFAGEQEDRCESRTSTKEPLQDVYKHILITLPTQHHRYRLARYTGVWRGYDIQQWIMDHTNNKSRVQASLVCSKLLSSGYIESVGSELSHFADYVLYRPKHIVTESNETNEPEESKRLIESVSSYCLDLNLGDSSARITKAHKTEEKASPSSEEENPLPEQSEGYTETRYVCKAILESGEDHLKLLTRQCLAREGLPASWDRVLYPLCQQAADLVMLDVHSNDIDVRNYVQVKKVSGGCVDDSCVLRGCVMSKNVAHRGMPQELDNPSVLLLDCSIAYQRVEGKLTSLEPVLMQEQEYLVRCAARIIALRPKLVLVRGSAARPVQDKLLKEGVALAVGVRARTLHRMARCTQADILTSIDARIGMPRLGHCKKFYVKNYSSKTLMVLENCAQSNLGCCILLRGASVQELTKVKKVAKFLLLACYNWKLERSFLVDIEAVLPEPGVTFEDSDAIVDTLLTNDIKSQNVTEKLKTEDTKSNSEHETGNQKLLTADDNDEHMYNDEGENEVVTKDNVDVREVPGRKSQAYIRKADSDKTLSCGVPIKDFSDPLQAPQLSMEDDVFIAKEETALKADSHNDRWSTDDMALSMSPQHAVPAPHAHCRLRPRPSPRPTPHVAPQSRQSTHEGDREMHPFIKWPIMTSIEEPAVKASLAHFRATGCWVNNADHQVNCALYNPTVLKKQTPKAAEMPSTEVEKEKEKESNEPLDPFAPENHQKLSLLLYSYSNKSGNVPDFCVNPWIVTMEMYGKNDISLGAFLDKYCFNSEYRCPSANCQIPMNQHVRRFVHGDVCITITCNTVGHSYVDKTPEDTKKQIMFWSRCEICSAGGRALRLSRASLCLSLAVYLSLSRAPRYSRAQCCQHPLTSHKHYFATHITTVCCRYNKISTFSIELPPAVISTHYDTKAMRDTLINSINELMLKGHDTFSALADSEAEKDHLNFKQHMEQIHLALTSTALQEQTTLAGVVRSLWNVSDRIITGERMLREAQDKWSSPAKPGKPPPDSNVEEKSDLDESGTVDMANESSESVPKDEIDRTVAEEDEEKGDKKTVRQILLQLLSNNQPANQTGIIISSGLIPIVVQANEIGSVIAATLASVTYQRTLQHAIYNNQSEQDEVENSSGREKSEGDKTKPAKSNDHIEVLLKDGLLCRVYYAVQFHRLRHMLLASLTNNHNIKDNFISSEAGRADGEAQCCVEDGKEYKSLCEIEEGFVRSLAHCVPWAAKGGKSGSTFCKSKDDRYVLKEMTKPEWQQFLEFAPHYFNYVMNCHQNKLPTMLARILGVYSVGGAGNGVLVMENLLYSRARLSHRFDLKGTRHRQTPPTQPAPVLMDDNLLEMRWKTQFYLQSQTASILWSGIERDTSFLANQCVMDYSLLLGLDENNTLVLGIIDYIRTFTWDKKLEHLVKKNLGSGSPTVVSPQQYRSRFVAAAHKYFLHCPAHWDHLAEPLL